MKLEILQVFYTLPLQETTDKIKLLIPYVFPLKHHSFVQNEIENLEKDGVIQKSLSPYASPIVVVPKKAPPGSTE